MALVAAAAVLAAVWVVDRLEQERFREANRTSVIQRLSTVRARLEGALNSRLFLTQGLLARVSTPSPALYPFLNLHVIVVRSGEGERGNWITETRNVAEDYRRLFGADPDKVQGVMIQINSQHTESRAESYWKSIRFTAR